MIVSKYTNIVSTTEIDQLLQCQYLGQPVIARFEILRTLLEKTVGSPGASLFTLPSAGFSKTRQKNVVTWYTDLSGVFRPLDALSPEERRAAEAYLRSQLAAACGVATAEEHGLLSVALNVASDQDLLFNGEAVILTNWGFANSLGSARGSVVSAFLPTGFVLATSFDDHNELSSADGSIEAGSQSDVMAADDREAQQATTLAPPSAARAVEMPEAGASNTLTAGIGGQRRAALWLSALAFILFLFVIYLLWPGNLLYPGGSSAAALSNPLTGGQADETSRDQLTRLRTALKGNLCQATNLEELDGIAGLPLIPNRGPQSSLTVPAPAGQVPSPGTTEPSLDFGGAPTPVTVPPVADETTSQTIRGFDLVRKLDNGTVLIVGTTSNEVSVGSGLVVTSNKVLTNDHVVADVQGGRILVANKHFARPLIAHVVARTGHSDGFDKDFALLELETPVDLPRLAITSQISRLDSVVAAGYPTFVAETDPTFVSAIRQGDVDRLTGLELSLTRGEITAVQSEPAGVSIIAHSATISPGNSGGPLVDRCGRVVGINTFTRSDPASALRLNYSLSSADALGFLAANGVSVTADGSACEVPPAATPGQTATAQAPGAPPATPTATTPTQAPQQ